MDDCYACFAISIILGIILCSLVDKCQRGTVCDVLDV